MCKDKVCWHQGRGERAADEAPGYHPVYNTDSVFLLSIILVLSDCIKTLFILIMEFFGVSLLFMLSPAGREWEHRHCIMRQGFGVSTFSEFILKYMSSPTFSENILALSLDRQLQGGHFAFLACAQARAAVEKVSRHIG